MLRFLLKEPKIKICSQTTLLLIKFSIKIPLQYNQTQTYVQKLHIMLLRNHLSKKVSDNNKNF